MPVHCCVPLCNQRGVTDSDGNKVSFHRFPRDPATYKKWIIAIKRDEGTHFQVTKSTKGCSKHFKECDYIPGVASAYRLLRDTAVPSVFSFAKEIKVRKPPKQRAQQMTNTAAKRPRQAPSSQGPDSSNEDTALEEAAVCSDSRMEAEQASVVPNSEIVVTGGEVKRLLGIISEQRAELSKLRDECPYLKEHLETARATIRKLQVENQNLIDELEAEKERRSAFCIDRFKGSDEAVLFYTGLPGYEHFLALMNFLNPGHNGCNVLRTENDSRRSAKGRRRKLSMENELFLVLVRLRQGLLEEDLAHRFNIAQSTVSRIFTSWINFMHSKLARMTIWPPREVVDATMPPEFAEKYGSTRVILDATGIRCEVPSSLSLQSSTYSTYKSCNTLKGLVGVLPCGLVAFVSDLYTGSISDRECVIQSEFLNLNFEGGNSVMADKGFRIEDLLEKKGVKLNMPPFLRGSTFTSDQVQETREIASLRIHVERRIQRIKAFHIYDRPIPLTLYPIINQIWSVTTILTNFRTPLIRKNVQGLGP